MPEDTFDVQARLPGEYTRREVLQGAGIGLLLMTASQELPWLLRHIIKEPDLRFLENAETYGPQPPKSVSGVTINTPFFYEQPEHNIHAIATRVRELQGDFTRVFIDNHTFDPDHDPVECTEAYPLDHALYTLNHDVGTPGHTDRSPIRAVVDLFDGFTIRQAEKGHYRTDYFTAPGQAENFFTNPEIRSRFKERILYLLHALQQNPYIAGWGIGNEMHVPGMTDDQQRDILTDWFAEMVEAVHTADPDRPIFTGLERPQQINESCFDPEYVVNTFHVYPWGYPWTGVGKHLATRKLSVSFQEMGFPEIPFVGHADELGALFIASILRSTSLPTSSGGVALPTRSYGFWKVGAHHDTYNLNTGMPRTSQAIRNVATACDLL